MHDLYGAERNKIIQEVQKMTQLQSQYVIEKLKKGEKVTCVNFNNYKISDCGSMTMDNLLKAIDDDMCLFFIKSA